jgi:GT2 family glycosyltransferase
VEPLISVCVLSRDKNPKVIKDLSQQTYRNFEIIYADKPGIVFAMNDALRRAKGKIFVRIDDDVELPQFWLKELARPFRDPKVGGVTGPTFVPANRRKNRDSLTFAYKPNWFLNWLFDGDQYAPAKIYRCGSVSYGSNFMDKMTKWYYEIDHLEATNWAMRTDLIRQVGGFDPAFDGVCEWYDDDVVFKVKKLGYKLVYRRKAYMWHMVEKGSHFNERFEVMSRLKNWLRFHTRHSKFHYKMVIFFTLMGGYLIWRKLQLLSRQFRAGKNS